MSNSKSLTLHEMANQFIELANMLVEQNGQKVHDVGAAMRYATARMNAHEFTHFSKTPLAEKPQAIRWFTDQYQTDLNQIIEDIIQNM
ncbi:MAG: DUF3144 domain-containing protein [Fibrobacterales bacterium]